MMKLNLKQRWQKLTDYQQKYLYGILISMAIMVSASFSLQQYLVPKIDPILFVGPDWILPYYAVQLCLLFGFTVGILFIGMLIESVRHHG